MEKLLKDYEDRIINKLHGVRVDFIEPLNEREKDHIEYNLFLHGKAKSMENIIKYILPVPSYMDDGSIWTESCVYIVTLDGVHVDDFLTRFYYVRIRESAPIGRVLRNEGRKTGRRKFSDKKPKPISAVEEIIKDKLSGIRRSTAGGNIRYVIPAPVPECYYGPAEEVTVDIFSDDGVNINSIKITVPSYMSKNAIRRLWQTLDGDRRVIETNEWFYEAYDDPIENDHYLISDVEDRIINKLHGAKLNTDELYANIDKYFGYNVETCRKCTPSQLPGMWTDSHFPDRYFYSYYTVPIYRPKYHDEFIKKVLIYIGTIDGEHVHYIAFLVPFDLKQIQEWEIINTAMGRKEPDMRVFGVSTLEEVEDRIINGLGGKRLTADYVHSHLNKFFNKAWCRDLEGKSPCQLERGLRYNEVELPDECFYGYYTFPISKLKGGQGKPTRPPLIFVGTDGGGNADYITCEFNAVDYNRREALDSFIRFGVKIE